MKSVVEQLQEINDTVIHPVESELFRTYGRIIEDVHLPQCLQYMKECTKIPAKGNCYVPSVSEMEEYQEAIAVQEVIYGGMEIQIGYCNGHNTSLNGLEFHKGSEVLAAVTDCFLFLGHTWDLVNNQFKAENAELFYVPQGKIIELYQTTMHLSPCQTTAEGFRAIIILPRGTNMELAYDNSNKTGEAALLLKQNKWVVAHPDWEPLIAQGAYPGLVGENRGGRFLL